MNRRTFIINSTQFLSLMALKLSDTTPYHIEQFEDKALAQFSYALLYDKKIILIDPARDPQPFYQYAAANGAQITAVIETHPHADFISSHAEIGRNKKATIYASHKLGAAYPHNALSHGDEIRLNDGLKLRILDTPGHSPDSISIVLCEDGKDVAVFTGDALLFGNVGRPDLRESGGSPETQREALARQMYHTIHQQYAKLADNVIVYPAHGAGSLCGGAVRNVKSSTIGYERANNYAFRQQTEDQFVREVLTDLPYVPKYFPYDVELNRKGPSDLAAALQAVPVLAANFTPALSTSPAAPTSTASTTPSTPLIVDTRPAAVINRSWLPDAVTIPEGGHFETWFGSVIGPGQNFYLAGENSDKLRAIIARLSKIGYEEKIKGAFVFNAPQPSPYPVIDDLAFSTSPAEFTIIDVRSPHEFTTENIFPSAINIPLPDLTNRLSDIPTDKPVVVVCASGYRSGIATSIIRKNGGLQEVFDLGKAVEKYKPQGPKTP